jgi:hypothetical protein
LDKPKKSSGKDKFGVECEYETVPGGVEFFQPKNVKSKKGGFYEFQFRNMKKGKVPSNDWEMKKKILNVEATGYFKLIEDDSDVSMKLRGGHHSNNGKDSARCYIFQLFSNGSSENNFAKEYPHGSGKKFYTFKSIKPKFKLGSIKNKWVGFKGAIYNVEEDGRKAVKCECYVDLKGVKGDDDKKPGKQEWKKWYEITDKGNLSKHKKRKEPWLTLQKNSKVNFRLDGFRAGKGNGTKKDWFKFISAREILK